MDDLVSFPAFWREVQIEKLLLFWNSYAWKRGSKTNICCFWNTPVKCARRLVWDGRFFSLKWLDIIVFNIIFLFFPFAPLLLIGGPFYSFPFAEIKATTITVRKSSIRLGYVYNVWLVDWRPSLKFASFLALREDALPFAAYLYCVGFGVVLFFCWRFCFLIQFLSNDCWLTTLESKYSVLLCCSLKDYFCGLE